MDREQILAELAEAKRHVAEGQQVLKQQRALLETLRANLDAAMVALEQSQESQKLHVADRDRLQRLLDEPPHL